MLAEYRPAMELAEQLLKQAESEQNPLHLTQAHHFIGYLNFCAGSFEPALSHFDSALTSFDPQVESLLMSGFIGQNMWLTSLFRKAWTLWFLGYPDQSLAALEETMIKVEQFGQDHDLAFTLAIGICPILYLRHEFDQAEVQAKRLLRLASRKGLHYFIPFGRVILGSVLVKRGRTAEGQNEIRTGIRLYREGGQKTFISFCLSILAESLGGDEEAGKVLDEATDLVEESGEVFFEAELNRLRGEFLWRRGADPAQVDGCYRQALDIARRQQAKSLELRAATSLAHLWQRQGRAQEAQTLLAGVYGGFTEGFETLDLQEAQTLLVELNGS
jgi:adenylate cyclase